MRPTPLRSSTVVSANSAGYKPDDARPRSEPRRPAVCRPATASSQDIANASSRTKIWSSLSIMACRLSFSRLRGRFAGFTAAVEGAAPAAGAAAAFAAAASAALWPWPPPWPSPRPAVHPPLRLPSGESGDNTRSISPVACRSSSRPPNRSSVDSSNSVFILIASNGQTSTQIWQLMQTEISISNFVG